jgi:glycine/D-amino acid oxidase-like deaminating enzyme
VIEGPPVAGAPLRSTDDSDGQLRDRADEMTRRVIVIGGGIVGLSTAALLARSGAEVTVIEREAIGAGASGRNSGSIQRPFDPVLAELYLESLELYRALAADEPASGFTLPRSPAGLLLVTHRAAVAAALASHLEATIPDLAAEVLDGPALARVEPALGPDVVAVRLPVGFPVVPALPTYAWAAAAEHHGAVIRIGHGARPQIRSDRVAGVIVDGVTLAADAVVVAAGPWTPEVVDPTGTWHPIRRSWGVVVDVLLARPPRHVIEEADMDAALGTGELAAGAGAERHDPETTPESSVVTAGGVSAVGSTFLSEEPDPEAWTERILGRAARFVPGIIDAPIRETRACARPVSVDGRPLVGAVPGVEGLFVGAGHGPWGISTGPASGRIIAAMVLGQLGAPPSPLDPARFGRPPVDAS